MDDVSFESEQALLAALLADPARWGDVAGVIRPEHFGVEAHRGIASTLLPRLATPGGEAPPDEITLLAALEREGKVPNPVPRDTLLGLARAVGTGAGARYYADIVADLWVRREVKRVAREALEDRATPGRELAAGLAQRVTALETSRARAGRQIDSFILAKLERLEAQRLAAVNGTAPPLERIPTGFRRLDGLVGGVAPGQATIVGARPGVGKSALASALADNFASAGNPVHIFQLEDYGESLADRAIARRARINSMLLRNGSSWRPETWDKLRELGPYSRLPIWVDDEHGISPLECAGKMRRAKRENGIRVFMLDVLAELDVERWIGGQLRDDRLDRLLGKALRLLRDTARDLDAALIVFLHLNREIEKRQDPSPRLADIKNSGDVEDAAHQIWFLSRPEGATSQFWIDVAKHRDGPTGKILLTWNGDLMAVENPREVI